MPLYSLEGKTPSVHPTAFVAPSADLIGDVTLEAGASVGPIEGTSAESWVASNPAAYQGLAQRYLAGFAEA